MTDGNRPVRTSIPPYALLARLLLETHATTAHRRRALLAYLAATVGLPLPPPPIVKDGGKAFPCQGRACGCQTAEECWRHCCCTTPEERWAWAAEHNVTTARLCRKTHHADP